MVISDEIKFPRPIQIASYRPKKKVEPADGAAPVARVGAFKREWQRNREERRRKAESLLSPPEAGTLRRLVAQVNAHLERRSIPIHLVLSRNEQGYAIDVYDCTDGEHCAIIADVIIDLDDLHVLLKNLEQEAGLLFDTVS